jgi:tRNA dimethylallyltransferase
MSEETRKKIIVIAGPTASGKTSVAVELALALEGEVINADSMQVYRGMDIGTAKPTMEERRGIPHHLLDVVAPDEAFNAATYRSLALSAVADIASRGKACLAVGGTGLYIRSLLEGLFDCAPADPAFREALQREWEIYGGPKLHERLQRVDPELAGRVHPNDRVRIIRFLEVYHLTGRPASALIKEQQAGDTSLDALKLGLELDREALYGRINDRSAAMVDGGLVEETEGLLRRGYAPHLKPMKAIGYRHAVAYLRGEWSLAELMDRLQQDTRRYAKRQLTWFRADPGMQWVPPWDLERILKKARQFLDEGH